MPPWALAIGGIGMRRGIVRRRVCVREVLPMTSIKADLLLIKWMTGFVLAFQIAIAARHSTNPVECTNGAPLPEAPLIP